MSRVYLAGAMSCFQEEGNYAPAVGWREKATVFLDASGIKVFNPTYLSEEQFSFKPGAPGVILQNYSYINKCDAILVNLDKLEESIGSIWELSIAWENNKSVVGFGTCEKFKNRPHFDALVPVRIETLEEACEYLIWGFCQ